MQGSQNGRFVNLHNSLKLQNLQKTHKKYKITKNKQIKMIADPLWSCVMLLCGPLWVFCGSFAVFSHTLFLYLLGMHWFAWAQTPLYTHPLYKFLFSTNDDENVCVLWRVSSQRRLLIKCGMRKVKCGMKTVERCCGTVGKMHNAEICRMWAIVCPQEGTVNSYEWAVSYISC